MYFKRAFNYVNCYYSWLQINRSFTRNLSGGNSLLPDELKTNFQNSLPKIIENTVNQSYFVNSPEAVLLMKKMTEHVTCTKTPVQGEIMLLAYEMHEDNKNMTKASRYRANVMAWSLETLQTYFQIIDDIEDEAIIRNGKIPWHVYRDVKMAINDNSLLRSFMQEMLRRNLEPELYVKVYDILNEIYTQIAIGQKMDFELSRTKNYDYFTLHAYSNIVRLKCTAFCVKFPILFALELCNRLTCHSYEVVNNISEDIGFIIQMRNDFLDWFVEDSVTGNSGTDIEKGKLTWLSVSALQRCNARQREEFVKCYGSFEEGKVKTIRRIYEELALNKLFNEEMKKRLNNYRNQINQLPVDVTPSLEFLRKLPKLLDIN